MMEALSPATARSRTLSVPKTIPAPVGGLNSRDPLASMRPEDALKLENFICRPTTVELRSGQVNYATGFTSNLQIDALLVYNNGAAGKLFACTNSGIFDVSVAGVVGASVYPSTNGHWSYVNSVNAGVRYIVAVNGTNKAIFYNGVTAAESVITGVDSATLTTVHQHQFRLFFTEAGTLTAWYLAVNAVQGAAVAFGLGPLFRKGGYLQAIGSWTVDNGTGSDDLAAFITSEGEVAVYRGTDPSNAATWTLLGIYETPKPVGRNCFYRLGGELLIITESGIVSLSKMLQSVAVDKTTSISDKTRGEISLLATMNKNALGWQMLRYSPQDILILNVPNATQENTVQMVMNTLTGAWSKFTSMGANCFAEFNGNLFYGTNAKVVQALTGQSDFGNNITATAKTAFNYFGYGMRSKHVKLLRPNFYLSKKTLINFALSVNFQINEPITQTTTSPNGVSLFDQSSWDQSYWADADFTDDQWRTVTQKMGYCISTLLQINDKDLSFKWNSTDYLLGIGSLFG